MRYLKNMSKNEIKIEWFLWDFRIFDKIMRKLEIKMDRWEFINNKLKILMKFNWIYEIDEIKWNEMNQ